MDKLDFSFEKKKYYVKQPTQADINEAELVYKIKFSQATRLGAMTSTEAQKIIDSRNLWGAEDQEKVHKLIIELNTKGADLMKTSKLAVGGQLLYEMKVLRDKIMLMNLRRNSILDNTAESYADDHRIQFYVVACTFNDDGSKAFEDLDAYLVQAGTEFGKTCLIKVITLVAHAGEDFRESWPETQWRKKQGLIDDDYNPIEKKMDELVKETLAATEKNVAVKKKAPRKKRVSKKTA